MVEKRWYVPVGVVDITTNLLAKVVSVPYKYDRGQLSSAH